MTKLTIKCLNTSLGPGSLRSNRFAHRFFSPYSPLRNLLPGFLNTYFLCICSCSFFTGWCAPEIRLIFFLGGGGDADSLRVQLSFQKGFCSTLTPPSNLSPDLFVVTSFPMTGIGGIKKESRQISPPFPVY